MLYHRGRENTKYVLILIIIHRQKPIKFHCDEKSLQQYKKNKKKEIFLNQFIVEYNEFG